VVNGLDFAAGSTIVDVGGGAGALLAAVLAAHPDARGILFDQPQVVSGADQTLGAAGVAGRCSVMSGNFFASVPDGGDVYVLSSVVHDWPDEPALEILRTCRHAMSPDARLILVEQVIGAPNVPEPVKALDLQMLLMHGGQERTAAEFAGLLEAAEFRLERIIPTSSPVSLIEGTPF
jgi:O-methyltransferase domain